MTTTGAAVARPTAQLPELPPGCAWDPELGAVRVPVAGGRAFVLVDLDVAPVVAAYQWRLDKAGYPYRRTGAKRWFYLHHVVLPNRPGGMTDHINHDPLDARRSNLRPADDASNQWNRQGVAGRVRHKGVCVHPGTGKYQAQIRWHGRNYFLGLYAEALHAACAYWLAARALYGEYLWTDLAPEQRRVPDGDAGMLVLRLVARAIAKAMRDDAERQRARTRAARLERRQATRRPTGTEGTDLVDVAA